MASLRKRGKVYYASYYVDGKECRKSLETSSYQVAKERLRNFESAVAHGALDDVLPTKTPVAEIVGEYAAYIKNWRVRKCRLQHSIVRSQPTITRPRGSSSL